MRRLTLLSVGLLFAQTAADVRPAIETEPVSHDADDPAIWRNPGNPAGSIVVGTNKVAAPDGALFVFGLDGRIRQKLGPLDRPNNVDVEYGMQLAGKQVDIAVVTERLKSRLRVYAIEGGNLSEISSGGGIPVLEGMQGEQAMPMGISLYRREKDGAIFAIVSPKNGPVENYLWQYRLTGDASGKVKGTFTRRFGKFSGKAEIEAVAVDDELGYVYYSDEDDSIRKYHADPDRAKGAAELARFGQTGFQGNQEGIAIYATGKGKGYILCTDQIASQSVYRIYRREGSKNNPHDHSELVKLVRGTSDSTDGLDASSASFGKQFPRGFVAAMNSKGKNFHFYRWEDFAVAGAVKLP
jgi:3-phytase